MAGCSLASIELLTQIRRTSGGQSSGDRGDGDLPAGRIGLMRTNIQNSQQNIHEAQYCMPPLSVNQANRQWSRKYVSHASPTQGYFLAIKGKRLEHLTTSSPLDPLFGGAENFIMSESCSASSHSPNSQIRVRELFVPDRLAIAITSMKRIGDKIYLGLTGGSRLLAVYDVATDEITMLAEICPWIGARGYCGKFHNAMGVLQDNSLLLGECSHLTWDGLPVTADYFKTELPERMLARKRAQGFSDIGYTDFCLPDLDGWDRRTMDPGGRILRYDPAADTVEEFCSLPPLMYAQSLLVDATGVHAFGHTIPDNHFYHIDLQTRKLTDHGRISDYAFHHMVVDPDGVCYAAWLDRANGSMKLLRFDPKTEKLEHTSRVILRDPGSKIAGNQGVDYWLVARDGTIYMGTVANSLLFRFDPHTQEFSLLGRLAEGGRVTSMDEDDDGILWISAGYPHTRLIRFDPHTPGPEAIKDCGPINPTYERCYVHSSCLYQNKLYLGETDGFSPSLHIVDLDSVR